MPIRTNQNVPIISFTVSPETNGREGDFSWVPVKKDSYGNPIWFKTKPNEYDKIEETFAVSFNKVTICSIPDSVLDFLIKASAAKAFNKTSMINHLLMNFSIYRVAKIVPALAIRGRCNSLLVNKDGKQMSYTYFLKNDSYGNSVNYCNPNSYNSLKSYIGSHVTIQNKVLKTIAIEFIETYCQNYVDDTIPPKEIVVSFNV